VAEATTREQLQAVLRTRTGSMAAFGQGFRLAARTAAIGLPAALAYGALSGALGAAITDATKTAETVDHATLELVAQVITFVGAMAALYGVIQFTKRDRVSRESWFPALFAIPCLLIGGGLYVQLSGQARQYGPVVLSLVLMGWSILFATFAGAAATIVWMRAGADALDGRPIRAGEILSETGRRLLEVAGPHGARVHAVTIGSQLLLPGIFYALQYAFTDALVVLDPERPALARSGQLAFGMKGRLFRLLLAWWVVGMVLTTGVAAVMQGMTTPEKIVELVAAMFVDPTSILPRTFAVQELVWAVLTWVLSLSMLVLYREREALVRAKTELKKLDAAAATGTG
jgi:hypothetical protein